MAFIADKTRQGVQKATGGYSIDQSLRFNDDDSAYLSRTPSSAGNRKTWTFSCWVKLGNAKEWDMLFYTGTGDRNHDHITFRNGEIGLTWDLKSYVTTAKYRDPSAWYHIVFAIDTTQTTASNRIKLYVNGSEVTDLNYNGDPGLDYNFRFMNTARIHYLGYSSFHPSPHFDGYMAEVNFIDGQALTPSDFGESGTYGEWKPIEYTGTYGTNGFYLDFADSADLGNDVSGEGNDWTTNNLAATDQMLDTPTNNFCTMTPLTNGKHGGNVVFSQGNLRVAITGDNFQRNAYSTFNLPKTGKWYWEVYVEAGDSSEIGIIEDAQDYQISDDWSFIGNGWAYAGSNGKKIDHGPSTTWGNSYGNTDLISVAVDMDNSKIWWAKNGTWQVSGNPSTGANAAYTNVSGNVSPAVGDNSSVAHTTISNFGQDSSFAGNKTAQGNTDDNGYGDFYYEPPTGFNALCTANLSDPAVIPSEHFNVKLFTGNGGTNTTDVGFAADLVWSKQRSTTAEHMLVDVLRGLTSSSGGYLRPNTTDGESGSWSYDAITTSGNNVISKYLTGYTGSANLNGATQVLWCWKANGTSVLNENGTLDSQVSANTDAGFSIVSYTGTGSNATVGHGLSSAPEMVIVKGRDQTAHWMVGSDYLTSWNYSMKMDNTSAESSDSMKWNNTSPSNTVFTVGTEPFTNGNNNTFVSYCFHSVDGYSKVGSYTGNGSTDGPFVYCGFRPAFVLIRCATSAEEWWMFDAKRDPDNLVHHALRPSGSSAESSGTAAGSEHMDFTSNGFKITARGGSVNGNTGGTYIFYAIAENPFKYTNAR